MGKKMSLALHLQINKLNIMRINSITKSLTQFILFFV